MSIFDEIREEMRHLPESSTTVEDAHMGLQYAQVLIPCLRTLGLEGDRHAFLKVAAIAVRGIEFVDAEIEAELEANE